MPLPFSQSACLSSWWFAPRCLVPAGCSPGSRTGPSFSRPSHIFPGQGLVCTLKGAAACPLNKTLPNLTSAKECPQEFPQDSISSVCPPPTAPPPLSCVRAPAIETEAGPSCTGTQPHSGSCLVLAATDISALGQTGARSAVVVATTAPKHKTVSQLVESAA